MKYIYTEEEKKIISDLYSQGHGSPYIAKVLGYKTCSIASYIRRNIGLRSCSQAAKKYHADDHFFDEIDNQEKAYWLGFMYADGYVTKAKYSKYVGLALAVKDKSHINKFKKALNSDYPIHEYICAGTCYNPGGKYARIVITSKDLFDGAVKQGIVERKTNLVKAPKIDDKWKHHFIRGYFDGDGCLAETSTERTHGFSIKILGTEKLLDYIKSFIEENGIAKINQYYKRKERQIVSNLELGGTIQSKKFLDLIYKDADTLLDRKYQRYLKLCNLINSRVTSEDVA